MNASYRRTLTSFLFVLLFSNGGRGIAAELLYGPQCPSINEPVTLIAYQASGLPYFLELRQETVTRTGSDIRVVVAVSYATFTGSFESAKEVTLGPLSAGTYRIELVGRDYDGTEATLAARQITVGQTSRSCTPAGVEIVGAPHRITTPGQVFPGTFEIKVVNAAGEPIEDERVTLRRYLYGADWSKPPYVFDATFDATSVVTDAQGMVRFRASAGEIAGTAQYQVSAVRPGKVYADYFVLTVRTSTATNAVVPVVEYANFGLNHYFMTADRSEMRALDTGVFSGWVRTGQVFLAHPAASAAGAPVCRFYGLPAAGLDSHFYSASGQECEEVARKFPDAWKLETSEAFRIGVPQSVGLPCPADQVPVFRVYNGRADANHRYSIHSQLLDFSNRGWIREGLGTAGIVMCSPL